MGKGCSVGCNCGVGSGVGGGVGGYTGGVGSGDGGGLTMIRFCGAGSCCDYITCTDDDVVVRC